MPYSVTWACVPVFGLISHCLNYYSFIISLGIQYGKFFHFCSFGLFWLLYHLHFNMKLGFFLTSHTHTQPCLSSYWDFVDSINQFGREMMSLQYLIFSFMGIPIHLVFNFSLYVSWFSLQRLCTSSVRFIFGYQIFFDAI